MKIIKILGFLVVMILIGLSFLLKTKDFKLIENLIINNFEKVNTKKDYVSL